MGFSQTGRERIMHQFKIVDQPGALNQALFEMPHGLYVLAAVHGGNNRDQPPNGQCLDAAMQVTSAPPRVVIGVENRSLTHELISKTGKFVLNVLDREDPMCPDTIRRFGFQSGRDVNKFEDFPFELSSSGIPVLPDAKAFYECTVIPEFIVDLDTH